MSQIRIAYVSMVALLFILGAAAPVTAEPATVHAVIETDPVSSGGDAADDPEVWVHQTDPASSLVIGTDKDAGLAIYDLSGKQRFFAPDGEMNNVDIRNQFPLGGKPVTIVAASNRTNNTIAVYTLNPEKLMLTAVTARPLKVDFDVYGFCLHHDPTSDTFHAFINSKEGDVQQFRLFDNGSGKIDAEPVVSFNVGTQPEGMVVDDARSMLYIGEERVAIWRYPLPIDLDETMRYPVDVIGPLGNIVPDVEGLTLYLQPGNAGYLVASNQGNDEFLIYERAGDNKFLGSVRIETHGGIDNVSGSDGVAVASGGLPAPFEEGMMVVQDDENDDGAQNFKYIPWSDIRAALDLP